MFVRSFAALGAQPTPIPAPEMYSALQTGVVDAMEGSAEVGYTFKIFEVTKYLSKTRHILLDGSFAINGAFFKGPPPAQQAALMKAAQEAAVAQRAAHFEREKSWLDKLAAANTLQINDVDLPAFAAALATLQNEFAANARATELLEKIRKV